MNETFNQEQPGLDASTLHAPLTSSSSNKGSTLTLESSASLMFAAAGYAWYPQEHRSHRGYRATVPPPGYTSCTLRPPPHR